MTAESAHASMFTEGTQRMDVMEYSERAMEILGQLMGEDVSYRKEFVSNKIDFSEVKE